MRRAGIRALMSAIGVVLLAGYLLAAYLVYRALVVVWIRRPDPLAAVGIVVLIALAAGVLSYWFGTARLLASLGASELPRERAPGVYARLDRLCARMDLEPPAVLVARFDAPNAFAIGGAGTGAIVVDVGLFRLLDGDALEAVLAHELAHLESRDGLVQTVAYSTVQLVIWGVLVLLTPVVLLLAGFARASAWIGGRPAGWLATPFGRAQLRVGQLVAVLGVALTLFVFAHSRRREFAADDRAAAVTGKPMALARGLAAIQRASDPRWRPRSSLYIHGDETGFLTRLFSTHPSMEDRIERLARRAR